MTSCDPLEHRLQRERERERVRVCSRALNYTVLLAYLTLISANGIDLERPFIMNIIKYPVTIK